jgi:predicted secreted Zn-dependent protease
MAGVRIPVPLGLDLGAANTAALTTPRSSATPGPAGLDPADDAEELGTDKKIVKVTKDWTDPPTVPPTFYEVSGKTLKDVLTELQKRPDDWGEGGGFVTGTGDPKANPPKEEIWLEPTDDGKGYTVALKGKFVLQLPKWKEYDKATAAQKKAWDDMLANLKKHEEEHVAISYRDAEKLVKALSGLPAKLAAQKVADSNTAIQTDQDDFDSAAKTDHGRKDFGTFKKVELDTSADPPPPPAKPTMP